MPSLIQEKGNVVKKLAWLAFLPLCLAILVGCETSETSCTLTVKNGSGSGSYAMMQVVSIAANAPAAGQTFNTWVGDVDGIADVGQSNTTIEIKQENVSIEATYTGSGSSTSQIPFGTSTAFVSGNKSADGGSEHYGDIDGMGVRLLANDGSKIDCANGYYFISKSLIDGTGAFNVKRLANGDAVISAHDFTSPSSRLHYQFAGWTVHASGGSVVKENPLILPEDEITGTLRGYWATVAN